MAINEDQQESLEKREQVPEPKEPIKIETDGIFNQDYLENIMPEPFNDNPMVPMMRVAAAEYVKAIRAQPPAFAEPPQAEHKVRIFHLPASYDSAIVEEIAREIETLLNDGYRCHMPTVCNDFLIMDFSRRKESEKDATVTR